MRPLSGYKINPRKGLAIKGIIGPITPRSPGWCYSITSRAVASKVPANQGVLQTDSYVVYGSLFEKNKEVTLAGCMAHVRRKFDEAVAYDAARAQYAVEEIAKLYTIEQHLRENPD